MHLLKVILRVYFANDCAIRYSHMRLKPFVSWKIKEIEQVFVQTTFQVCDIQVI